MRGQGIGWETFGRKRTRNVGDILGQMQRDLGIDARDATDVLDLGVLEGAAGTGGGASRKWPYPRVTLNQSTIMRLAEGIEDPTRQAATQQYLKALVYEEFLHNIDNIMGLKHGGGRGGKGAYASSGAARTPLGVAQGLHAGALNVGSVTQREAMSASGPWSALSPRPHPFAAIAELAGPDEQKRLALLAPEQSDGVADAGSGAQSGHRAPGRLY